MNNLVDPDGSTLGCSVNFRNNELAVTNFFGPHGQGSVEFWKNSTGTPTSIIAPNIYYYWYCGYDDKGELVYRRFSSGSSMSLAVRRRGRNKFETINIDVNPFWYPGGVQWDGKYLAVGDEYGPIYRYAIVGNKATEIDTVTLNDENEVPQFWIHGTTVIAPNSNGHNTEISRVSGGRRSDRDDRRQRPDRLDDQPSEKVVCRGVHRVRPRCERNAAQVEVPMPRSFFRRAAATGSRRRVPADRPCPASAFCRPSCGSSRRRSRRRSTTSRAEWSSGSPSLPKSWSV